MEELDGRVYTGVCTPKPARDTLWMDWEAGGRCRLDGVPAPPYVDLYPFRRLHLHSSFAELKRGNSQDLTISPKLDRYKIARQLTEKAIKVRPLGAQWDMQSMENYRAGLWGPLLLTPQTL